MTVHVLNARTLAVSTYTPAPLDVVEHVGEVYFLTATALTKLDATADLDVPAYVETGDLDILPGASLSFEAARVTLLADHAATLTATAHRDGDAREVNYLIPLRSGDQARGRFVKLAKGFRGNSWRFKFQAQGAWALEGLSLILHAIRNHRR